MCLFFIQQASFFQIYITNHEQSFGVRFFFYTNLNENCCDTVLSIRFLEDPIFGYNSNTFFNLFKNFTIHEVTQRHPIWSSNKTAKLKSFSVFLSDMNYPHSTRVRGGGCGTTRCDPFLSLFSERDGTSSALYCWRFNLNFFFLKNYANPFSLSLDIFYLWNE